MVGPQIGRPVMKQPSFNWETDDKYSELKNFRFEVNNIITSYNIPYAEQLAIVENWLGRKGLQFIESLIHVEGEECNTLEGLFKILMNKSRPQFNEMIRSLHIFKLSRQDGEMQRNGWAG